MAAAPPKKRASWRSAARGARGVDPALRRLGQRVRALRAEQGLTQEATAQSAALDAKHLQSIEAGRVNVTMASLVGLARALHVTLSQLFEGV